jgi:hypothetical protein
MCHRQKKTAHNDDQTHHREPQPHCSRTMAESPPSWASQPATDRGSARKQGSARKPTAPPTPTGDATTDRTAVVSAQLKRIYKKAVLPVEKRYKYDYFYDSPLLTDIEFDGR